MQTVDAAAAPPGVKEPEPMSDRTSADQQAPEPLRAPEPSPNPQARLRLLKVTVQATYAIDDGTTLRELAAQPVDVPSSEWPAFAARDPLAWVDGDQIPGVAR